MKESRHYILFAVVLFIGIILFSGCTTFSNFLEEKEIVRVTGKIVFVDIEGGFYGIVADDGKRYNLVNPPKTFKDGFSGNFTLQLRKNRPSIRMWGVPAKVLRYHITGVEEHPKSHAE